MNIIDEDQILKAFLESNCAHWVHEPAIPPIERDAKYKCRLNVVGILVTYEILVYKCSLKPGDTERKIELNFALSEEPWFGSKVLERSVELSGAGSNIAALTWPDTNDPVIQKVAEIAKVAPLVHFTPQSIN